MGAGLAGCRAKGCVYVVVVWMLMLMGGRNLVLRRWDDPGWLPEWGAWSLPLSAPTLAVASGRPQRAIPCPGRPAALASGVLLLSISRARTSPAGPIDGMGQIRDIA